MNNNAPGKGFLKVSGILMIIFSILGLLFVVLGGALAAVFTSGLMTVGVIIAFLISAALLVLELIVGILGVKNCDKPDKAQSCFTLGALLIAIVVVNAIISVISGTLVWWSVLTSLVLPVIYVIGALKNKEVSGTGVSGSIIDQAKDAIGDAQADIKSGAIKEQVKGAADDAMAGAKEISGQVVGEAKDLGEKAVDAGKEVVDKVTDMVDGDKK